MHICTRGHHTMVTETSKTANFQIHFYNMFLLLNLLINITFLYWKVFRQVKETNETTTLEAGFFYNSFLY